MSATEQLSYLLVCIKHTSTGGKINFDSVSQELGITKAAAAKRYERLKKRAQGLDGAGVSDEAPMTPSATPSPKKAATARKPRAPKSPKTPQTPRKAGPASNKRKRMLMPTEVEDSDGDDDDDKVSEDHADYAAASASAREAESVSPHRDGRPVRKLARKASAAIKAEAAISLAEDEAERANYMQQIKAEIALEGEVVDSAVDSAVDSVKDKVDENVDDGVENNVKDEFVDDADMENTIEDRFALINKGI